MKKFLIMVILIMTLSGCTSYSVVSESVPQTGSNFDFSLQFSVNGNDLKSTFDDSFKSNTIEGYKTIKLVLTDDELNIEIV